MKTILIILIFSFYCNSCSSKNHIVNINQIDEKSEKNRSRIINQVRILSSIKNTSERESQFMLYKKHWQKHPELKRLTIDSVDWNYVLKTDLANSYTQTSRYVDSTEYYYISDDLQGLSYYYIYQGVSFKVTEIYDLRKSTEEKPKGQQLSFE